MGGLMAAKGHEVVMLGHDAKEVTVMNRRRRNDKFLEGYDFPDSLRATMDPEETFAEATMVFSAIPTKYVRGTWSGLCELVPARIPIISLTKGIELATLERPSQIISSVCQRRGVAVLSGPSHAEEVARGLATTVVIAARSLPLARRLRDELSTPNFRVYANDDLFGVEFGGAMKNIIAIAAGILDGLGLGDNTKAALLTRGLVETATLGCALGAKKKTFYGMAGVGDLITTAFSPFGRNRAVGERIGRGETLDEILRTSVKIAEGVGTTKSIRKLAHSVGIEMPITDQVYAVLFRRKDPRRAITQLMTRERRHE